MRDSINHNIKLVRELTILGVLINRGAENVTDQNIQLKMSIIKKEIEHWKRRCLTPIGKIAIIKALLLSKLVHVFIAMTNPSKQCIKNWKKYFLVSSVARVTK